MPGMTLSGNNPAAVRKPQFEVAFGTGGTGLPGGENPWQNSTRAIATCGALAPHVDMARIWIAGGTQAPAVAVADEGEIALGYEDDTTACVFTAVVDHIQNTIHGSKRIEALNGSAALARLCINQSYEQQSAGDIVTDLASQAGVSTGTVESGADFPFYTIDDRLSAWDHIAKLAEKCGFGAYFTPENELCFGPLDTGQAVQTFTYGIDILAFQSIERAASATAVTVVGEGAAGSQGDDAWSWLVKDPAAVSAESGDGPGSKIIPLPSLRSAEAAQAAADGLAAAASRKTNAGRLVVAGAPAVSVGCTIDLADLPESSLNGSCLVTRVVHEYAKREGFISRIDFFKPDDGGMGGGR